MLPALTEVWVTETQRGKTYEAASIHPNLPLSDLARSKSIHSSAWKLLKTSQVRARNTACYAEHIKPVDIASNLARHINKLT